MLPYGTATPVTQDSERLTNPPAACLHPSLLDAPAAYSFPCANWKDTWKYPKSQRSGSTWGGLPALLWSSAHASIAWSKHVSVESDPDSVSAACFLLAVIDKALELNRLIPLQQVRVYMRSHSYRAADNPSWAIRFKTVAEWRNATASLVPWSYQLAVVALGGTHPPVAYADVAPLVEGALDIGYGRNSTRWSDREELKREDMRPFDPSIIEPFDVPFRPTPQSIRAEEEYQAMLASARAPRKTRRKRDAGVKLGSKSKVRKSTVKSKLAGKGSLQMQVLTRNFERMRAGKE